MSVAQKIAAANAQASTHQAIAKSQNFHGESPRLSTRHPRVNIGAAKWLTTYKGRHEASGDPRL